jgi:hypothetical protein
MPNNSAARRAWPHLTRLKVSTLLALHRWLPMLSRLLG